MKYFKCPVCSFPATIEENGRGKDVDCLRCGLFHTVNDGLECLRAAAFDPRQVAAVSGRIRRNAGCTIDPVEIPQFARFPMATVPDKASRLMLVFSKYHPFPGRDFNHPSTAIATLEDGVRRARLSSDRTYTETGFDDLDKMAATCLGETGAVDGDEVNWLISTCLVKRGLLDKGTTVGTLQITPQGWQEIARLQEVNTTSRQAFVAMAFASEYDRAYDGALLPGINAAGYDSFRADKHHHNNQIDDEIIAQIKRSRFLVADLSMDRGGTYFEAGYAMGLGLTVIWTVRFDQLDQVHFDTRQFNYIKWWPDDLPKFLKAIQMRIEATIGRSPVAPKPSPKPVGPGVGPLLPPA